MLHPCVRLVTCRVILGEALGGESLFSRDAALPNPGALVKVSRGAGYGLRCAGLGDRVLRSCCCSDESQQCPRLRANR